MRSSRRFASIRVCLLLGAFPAVLPALAQTRSSSLPPSQQAQAPPVSVTGIVAKPGLYPWRPGLRVLDLLATSGGPTGVPERARVTLITHDRTTAVPINLDALLSRKNPADNRVLLPGDTLVAAPASTGGHVSMSGQIAKPGAYAVPEEGAALSALLSQAGGALPGALLSRAQIASGPKTKIVDLRPLPVKNPAAAINLRLFPGDTLLLPERGRVIVSGAVRHSGAFPMPDAKPLTVARALALAGGPDTGANIDGILIARRRQAGPIEDIRARLKDELRAGDILIVPLYSRGARVRPWPIATTGG